MKPLLLSLVLVAGAFTTSAKTIVDGYFLTLKNDTVKCRINVNDLDLFDKVSIIDTSGKSFSYKAKRREINGFGFTYKNEQYAYLLKADEDSNWRFMIRTADGKRFELFYRFTVTEVYNGGPVQTDYYLIFSDGEQRLLSLQNGIFSPYKRRMKEWLAGDTAMLDLFDKTVKKFSDIPDFVKQANAAN
ncbi:MAG TPA: hypothetical protein VGR89_15235 [Puia sp.]|nr:hypothetical protein [Puia sp.]